MKQLNVEWMPETNNDISLTIIGARHRSVREKRAAEVRGQDHVTAVFAHSKLIVISEERDIQWEATGW